MKKFIIVLCALFIGSAVSAASSEEPRKLYTFSLVGCAPKTLENLVELEKAHRRKPLSNAELFKKGCEIIESGRKDEVVGLLAQVAQPSEQAFLTFIKEKIGAQFDPPIGFRYAFAHPTKKTITKISPVPLYAIHPPSSDYTLEHVMVIIPPTRDAAATLNEINIKLQTGRIEMLDKPLHHSIVYVHSLSPCANAECTECGTKACGRCRTSFYCSAACQQTTWKEHKKVCKAREDASSADTKK